VPDDGYRGRMGLYEIMLMSPALRKLVTEETDDSKIREQAYKEGMKPLRVSGAMKIAAGSPRRRSHQGRAARLTTPAPGCGRPALSRGYVATRARRRPLRRRFPICGTRVALRGRTSIVADSLPITGALPAGGRFSARAR
jgi:hypothetical protein